MANVIMTKIFIEQLIVSTLNTFIFTGTERSPSCETGHIYIFRRLKARKPVIYFYFNGKLLFDVRKFMSCDSD